MNDTKRNDSLAVKLLAIIGFSATILFIAWLLFVAIKGSPDAFSSLASIVARKESVQEEIAQEEIKELTIATQKTIVNSRELFRLSWTDLAIDGSYEFSFQCTEPTIKLLISSTEAAHDPLPCNTPLSLSSKTTELTMSIVSDSVRFAEVPITLVFRDTTGKNVKGTTLTMTAINTTVSDSEQTQEVAGATTTDETSVAIVEEEESEVEEVVQTPTTLVTPIYYGYPTSNLNGYIDLKISIQSVVGNTVVIDIVNLGTKTSNNWSFILSTPQQTVYNSPAELPLKPKEHAVFTFTDVNTSRGIVATVTTSSDSNLLNNSSVR